MEQVIEYETEISTEFMSLRVVPQCTNTAYNEFIRHANATQDFEYEIGSGPLSLAYPPETFSNTWYSGCGKISAKLIDYDRTLATLKTDEIVIESSDET